MPSVDPTVPLEAVLCTAELQQSAARPPDHEAENTRLLMLVKAMADSPRTILQAMADRMLTDFRVGSAGVSILRKDTAIPGFYWPAIAGAWQAHAGGGTRREFSPCGDVIDSKAAQLFRRPQRRYASFATVVPSIEECLLAPFDIAGEPVGTIWLVSHEARRKFDAEDLRQLVSLASFASSAWQATTFAESMLAMNEALVLGSLRQHEFAEKEATLNELLREEILSRERVEAELKVTTAIAEKANLAKSDFLSSMSHELRTPLSAILGFAQVMELGNPAPTALQQRSLDQIIKAGWYLADLINEILDLALVESGKLALTLQRTPVAEVIRECQTMVEPQAQKNAITLSVPGPEPAFFVCADRTRLKQVLVNLLSNAIKYNRTGGSVVVQCAARAGGRIRISVEDTGHGLSPAQLSQLFQLFNRLGQETATVEGTGIGLVMTKRLTELMGGTVGAESTPGKGSVFWIELDQSSAPEPGASTTPQADSSHSLYTSRRTLLHIEDNASNLMLIEDLLVARPDIRLLSTRDGHHGIKLAREVRPDVILMDINLPGITGLEVFAALAGDPLTANIPVIALSAHAMPADINKCLDAGFFRYLTKPIRVNEFMDTIDLAMELAQSRQKPTTGA